ncbi:LysR family transcriptional regulator [Candidatus Halocynthiibacter alkanivorans]|uniref:LysR family transcriptional regulator n=1 Tax=Candidatus Halocynthiibacter alkanivorans TaxID=2267619 RepID=UPI000DF26CA7|nr:LysR family transcriptional regulator [Candidatus Halocynthiibacter alkanivorans]
MNSWDDIRYFLSVSRSGSVRAAATALNVNHSTVLRRVSNLEAQLGTQLFEKLPSGYRLTLAGEEILDLATSMEASSSLLQTRVFARDQNLKGPLRIAMPPSLATDLLMPDLATFSRLHPEIELQISSSYEAVNLTKRQADLAIRLVYDQAALPQHLFGSAVQDVHRSVYISQALQSANQNGNAKVPKWILKEEDGDVPSWASDVAIPADTPPVKVSDLASQLAAVRAGMGMTILPCFVGDMDQSLTRLKGAATHYYGTLWILTHGETRKTARVRLFGDFIKTRISAYKDLLGGSVPIDRLPLG